MFVKQLIVQSSTTHTFLMPRHLSVIVCTLCWGSTQGTCTAFFIQACEHHRHHSPFIDHGTACARCHRASYWNTPPQDTAGATPTTTGCVAPLQVLRLHQSKRRLSSGNAAAFSTMRSSVVTTLLFFSVLGAIKLLRLSRSSRFTHGMEACTNDGHKSAESHGRYQTRFACVTALAAAAAT